MPIQEHIPGGSQQQRLTPITAGELATALGVNIAVATRLLEVANELVERFAPEAPVSIRREAIIRCAGWLLESPSSGIRDESAGPLSASYSPSMTGALRHSGAMSLLSPWKIRRAGAIG